MYKSTCIEEAKFEKNMYSWNDEDYDSEYQLDKGGVEKYFNTDEEVIIIALKSLLNIGKDLISRKNPIILYHVSGKICQFGSL